MTIRQSLSLRVRWSVYTVLLLCGMFVTSSGAADGFPRLRGDIYLHDPSTILECDGRYYVYFTGDGIGIHSSADGITWVYEGQVFNSPPSWTTSTITGFDGFFWAPDIVEVDGRYYLYYSVSTWGSRRSAIGLAINTTLNPDDPEYQWVDQGLIVQSYHTSNFNAIDPSVLLTESGQLWMAFASYCDGIFMIRLNRSTGKRISSNSTMTHLAYKDMIEGAALIEHDDWYYLFVNWGGCCDGVDSTYEIRVGRSQSITGPYYDRDGVRMTSGGGTFFMEGSGNVIGPGHFSLFPQDHGDYFAIHYYDADYGTYGDKVGGQTTHGIFPMTWDDEGWPIAEADWMANYRFASDVRDDRGRFHGLLHEDATIVADDTYGSVLDLSADNAYVELPSGVGFARTYVAVVKANDLNEGQRIFSLGQGDDEILLTPAIKADVGLVPNYKSPSTVSRKP